jgi:hypothetical protein
MAYHGCYQISNSVFKQSHEIHYNIFIVKALTLYLIVDPDPLQSVLRRRSKR